MKVGIPKEIHSGEKRVAATPEVVGQLIKLGFVVAVQSGAGVAAHFSDAAYSEAGATVVENAKAVWKDSDIL
ncbi:MAG: NAD(P)(+) transhydrogenase (Re/Si-specific) subunit alpha, partial [Nitrospinae bacterium]|nr:NAD(P)(+) transhydrogenase (Re/Si-specific) subunit alpha [Nitrospinota bacterium]